MIIHFIYFKQIYLVQNLAIKEVGLVFFVLVKWKVTKKSVIMRCNTFLPGEEITTTRATATTTTAASFTSLTGTNDVLVVYDSMIFLSQICAPNFKCSCRQHSYFYIVYLYEWERKRESCLLI